MATYSYTTTVYCKGEAKFVERFRRIFRVAFSQYDDEDFDDEDNVLGDIKIEPTRFNVSMTAEGVYKAEYSFDQIRTIILGDPENPEKLYGPSDELSPLFDFGSALSFFIYIENLENSFDSRRYSGLYILCDNILKNIISINDDSNNNDSEMLEYDDAEATEILDNWRDKTMKPLLDLWLSGFFEDGGEFKKKAQVFERPKGKNNYELWSIAIMDTFFITRSHDPVEGALENIDILTFNSKDPCNMAAKILIEQKCNKQGFKKHNDGDGDNSKDLKSTGSGGIGPGTSARNLAHLFLGREAQSPTDVTEILRKVHETIANGQIRNFVLGDFFNLPISASNPFVVAGGDEGYGAIKITENADFGAKGRHLGFMIVSINGLKGKNGNNFDHVVFHTINNLGTDYWMERDDTNRNGYLGSRMRQYLLNNMMTALKNHGVPFEQSWIGAPVRRVSKGGDAENPGFDEITDKLFLPTEYEMHGAHKRSNSKAEASANQGRFEYYNSDTRRKKHDKDGNACYYWCASPYSGTIDFFCLVSNAGSHYGSAASDNECGVAPAFCVAAV